MLLALLVHPVFALAPPLFNAPRGIQDQAFNLSLVPSAPGESILYSLNGGPPTTTYTGPLAIGQSTVVRAQEQAADGTLSEIVTASYFFMADILSSPVMDPTIVQSAHYGPQLEETLRNLPMISLVVPAGLSTVETAASFEWIDPTSEDAQVNCGAALTGTTSLGYPKNSIRLYFRDDYGAPTWYFDVFASDPTGIVPSLEHDALSLRSGHDSVFYLGAQGQYTRNMWMDQSQLEMGHLAPHGGFAHMYVNGSYFGLYHVRERFNAAFMSEYLGGDEDDYEMVNQGTVISGSGAGWAQVVANTQNFAAIGDALNIPDFMDYMVLNFYAGNAWDWSDYHNWVAAGPSAPGQGGFRFESSDSDIVLYYDYTVNILNNPGPADMFYYMKAEGHPDFWVALADAIHRNLEGSGPLTPDQAAARFSRLSGLIDTAVVAESARWGGGWWDRDEEWVTERDRLLNTFFPQRTDELLRQMREVGWYPLPAPQFSQPGGLVVAGTDVSISTDTTAELWFCTDGQDPRLSGGGLAACAVGPDPQQTVTLSHSLQLKARLRTGETWGPLESAFYEVDEDPAVILNEWNAVRADALLPEGDAAWGQIPGNGGDWIELLVMKDVDLRGWRLDMVDRHEVPGTLVFSDDAFLSQIRGGTIITIAEDLPEDISYDPDGGDWRFHLRAAPDGQYIRGNGFEVSHLDWQLTLRDSEGFIRFGPVGEGIAPLSGIASDEVGQLAADPSPSVRRQSSDYGPSKHSTFGAANTWGLQVQDLSALRGQTGSIDEFEDSEPPTVDSDPPTLQPSPPEAEGCGCQSIGGIPGVLAILLPIFWLRRRSAFLALSGMVACQPSSPIEPITKDSPPDTTQDSDPIDTTTPDTNCGPEVCNGVDDDCNGLIDDAVVDGLPFYSDADGDGVGSEVIIHACVLGEGIALSSGDCDDSDASRYPGAPEICDAIDQDCNGQAGDAIGLSQECPANSCLEAALSGETVDGARWILLPSGESAQLWCDLSTDGGGWTLGFLRNTASMGSQGDFGSGDVSVEALATSPEAASVSSVPALAWTDLNAYAWTELRVAAYSQGALTYTSRSILHDDLRIEFGQDGYLLYGESGYYWCGGDRSYTDWGQGSVNTPEGAPSGCKYHGSLGSGWDFSESPYANVGLTLCGGDGSYFLAATYGGTWISYGGTGGAEAIWVR